MAACVREVGCAVEAVSIGRNQFVYGGLGYPVVHLSVCNDLGIGKRLRLAVSLPGFSIGSSHVTLLATFSQRHMFSPANGGSAVHRITSTRTRNLHDSQDDLRA